MRGSKKGKSVTNEEKSVTNEEIRNGGAALIALADAFEEAQTTLKTIQEIPMEDQAILELLGDKASNLRHALTAATNATSCVAMPDSYGKSADALFYNLCSIRLGIVRSDNIGYIPQHDNYGKPLRAALPTTPSTAQASVPRNADGVHLVGSSSSFAMQLPSSSNAFQARVQLDGNESASGRDRDVPQDSPALAVEARNQEDEETEDMNY